MIRIFIVVLCAWGCAVVEAQQAGVMFYNVENLFDTKDDSLTRDEEFLPEGERHWTLERMNRKITRIYQTVVAFGRGEMPAVIGLCEIENREVLEALVYRTPLCRYEYRIAHRESKDARGIDVALLYRPDLFKPDSMAWLTVPLASGETTREILMVRGLLWNDVGLFFFVNHWPSRYGGAGGSAGKRLAAASTLAVAVKGILAVERDANIILMGDFNDEPGDESLQAINKIIAIEAGKKDFFANLSAKTSFIGLDGTIKHQGTWSVFDQMLVSSSVFSGSNGCHLLGEKADIFKAGFLLEPDRSHSGVMPYRTYVGPSYHGGFSDHLPVGIMLGKPGPVY